MTLEGDAKKLTIYLGSSDRWHGRNLALAIVERCRAEGIAGVTVSRGIMGFGKQSRIQRAHLLGLSEDLPERIDIVDRAERISQIVPALEEMLGGGLMVIQDLKVLCHRPHERPGGTES
jgi:PII-like signaling protein